MILLAISIALILHINAISYYPQQLNVDGEFSALNSVISNKFWDVSSPYASNTVLSLGVLGIILSSILNINIINLLKYMYPLLYSLVPVTLYFVYSKQIPKKTAFLSVFLLIRLYLFLH